MKNGKHAFIEVPAATTIEDCWKLVDTSEATRKHCILCENCCYGYTELMVLNMVRDGLFGDLLYGAGAYLHDLRRLYSKTAAKGYGGATGTPNATATCIRRTAWDRLPTTWG